MSDNTEDVRTKVSPQAMAVLRAVSQSRGIEIQEILRELVGRFVDDKIHETNLICANLKSEGIDAQAGARRGKAAFCVSDPESTHGG